MYIIIPKTTTINYLNNNSIEKIKLNYTYLIKPREERKRRKINKEQMKQVGIKYLYSPF
jgi:hypothetical protein